MPDNNSGAICRNCGNTGRDMFGNRCPCKSGQTTDNANRTMYPCSLDYGDTGWDANGSPVNEPVHPLRRAQRDEPHTCWLCGRATPRTLMHDWLLALVLANDGQQIRRWVCGSACQMMAVLLLQGIVTLDRWAA